MKIIKIKNKIKGLRPNILKKLLILFLFFILFLFSNKIIRAENYISYEKYHDSFSLIIKDFTIEKLNYNAGETIIGSFDVLINENKTKAPITEAYVYIRVLFATDEEKQENSDDYLTLHSLGTLVKGPFTLNLGDKKHFEFEFKLPENSPKGDYVIAVSSKMNDFDIAGHNEIQGLWAKSIDFKVNNNIKNYAIFDVYNIKVNNQKFNFATFTPEFSPEEDIIIEVPIKNFGESKFLDLNYKLFVYNEEKHKKTREIIEQNLIQDKNFIKEFKTIDSKENKETIYIQDIQNFMINLGKLPPGLYTIKLYLKDENNFNEELIFRIPINGIDSKILFKKINTFPIRKDEKVMIGIGFSNPSTNAALITNPLLISETYTGNFEEIGTPYRSNAEIEINLTSNSELIFNKRMPVIVTPLYEAIETGFLAEKDINNLELKVAIYDENGLRDFNIVKYDCSVFPSKNLKVDYEVKTKKSGITLEVKARDDYCNKSINSSYIIKDEQERVVYADTFTTPLTKNLELSTGKYKATIKVEDKILEKEFEIKGSKTIVNGEIEKQESSAEKEKLISSERFVLIIFYALFFVLIILIITFFIYKKRKKLKIKNQIQNTQNTDTYQKS
ncbi:MAG: hypothetical protein QXU20_01750 [Candidatus Woesearchaeota archaeon]